MPDRIRVTVEFEASGKTWKTWVGGHIEKPTDERLKSFLVNEIDESCTLGRRKDAW